MTPRRLPLAALCAVFVLNFLVLRPAAAQLSLQLTPDTETTAGGVPAVYNAQLDNQAPTGNLFLNGIAFAFSGSAAPFLTANDSQFALAPAFLTPTGTSGSRYSGPLFSIRPFFQTPPGTYSGAVTLLGGATSTELFPLRTVAFTLIATQGFGRDAPEPATIGYWVIGLLGYWALGIKSGERAQGAGNRLRRIFGTIQ